MGQVSGRYRAGSSAPRHLGSGTGQDARRTAPRSTVPGSEPWPRMSGCRVLTVALRAADRPTGAVPGRNDLGLAGLGSRSARHTCQPRQGQASFPAARGSTSGQRGSELHGDSAAGSAGVRMPATARAQPASQPEPGPPWRSWPALAHGPACRTAGAGRPTGLPRPSSDP